MSQTENFISVDKKKRPCNEARASN